MYEVGGGANAKGGGGEEELTSHMQRHGSHRGSKALAERVGSKFKAAVSGSLWS